jgi:hypothetical protein
VMLHVTNGGSAAEQIRQSGLPGDILPWSDVLHEGPVPAGLSLEALRHIRARFITAQGWGTLGDVLAEFAARDRMLASCGEYEEVVLWFEHDLYDQLQLLQILDWFSGRELGGTHLSIIGVKDYLGTLQEDRVRTCFENRQRTIPEDLEAGRNGWAAFRNPDPTTVEALMHKGLPELPYLGAAFMRHLQEFPSVKNGLSLSEENALLAIAGGRSLLHEAFVASHHEREEHVFLADAVFATYLQRLSLVDKPLVVFEDGARLIVPRDPAAREVFWSKRAALTETGKDVASGKLDFVRLNGIDRWRGGVYLNGRGAVWRWDSDRQILHYL